MEAIHLMPGQECCVPCQNAAGAARIHYYYCSERGAVFNCICRTLDEAQTRCEDWLLRQDRCYRN